MTWSTRMKTSSIFHIFLLAKNEECKISVLYQMIRPISTPKYFVPITVKF